MQEYLAFNNIHFIDLIIKKRYTWLKNKLINLHTVSPKVWAEKTDRQIARYQVFDSLESHVFL